MAQDEYVTNEAWVRTLGRADTIDDIADQFERRAPVSASLPFERPTTPAAGRWPRPSRGWRSLGLLHGRGQDERLHS